MCYAVIEKRRVKFYPNGCVFVAHSSEEYDEKIHEYANRKNINDFEFYTMYNRKNSTINSSTYIDEAHYDYFDFNAFWEFMHTEFYGVISNSFSRDLMENIIYYVLMRTPTIDAAIDILVELVPEITEDEWEMFFE